VGTIPSVPSTGVTVNGFPLHTDALMAFIAGFVTIVMVSVNVVPTHVPETGVTV
jgi:hypothetical protein